MEVGGHNNFMGNYNANQNRIESFLPYMHEEEPII